jgi:hypothetical protein
MTPVSFIPIWFNFTLFISGILFIGICLLCVFKRIFPWFVNFPMLSYAIHFSVFYGVVFKAQFLKEFLSNELMTLWSAVLRFHGLVTAILMMYILYLTYGKLHR